MKFFGCLCYITNTLPHKGKFDSRAFPCVFLGYLFGQKGYKVFNLESHDVVISRDVIFQEDVFPFKKDSFNESGEIPLPVIPHLINEDEDSDFILNSGDNADDSNYHESETRNT